VAARASTKADKERWRASVRPPSAVEVVGAARAWPIETLLSGCHPSGIEGDDDGFLGGLIDYIDYVVDALQVTRPR
jgi:hypothetical protein